MMGLISKTRWSKLQFTAVLVIIFIAGWFAFAFYIYSNQILLISIQGEITDFQATTLALHQGLVDDKVKAVVLYFNTGGGLAYSCLEIASYVKQLAVVKPVIAVMGQLCASGGYYIASFADHIFTHGNTITGSIGVIATWVDMTQYNEIMGINITVWTTGPEKDFGADWRSPTPEEYDQIATAVDSIFQTLITDIGENRNLSQENSDIIKTGATFSGLDAKRMGLADEVGDVMNAVDEAVNRTGLWRVLIVSPAMDERQKFLQALI
jgi:protease-4